MQTVTDTSRVTIEVIMMLCGESMSTGMREKMETLRRR